jgi:muramoyltetrapeptide carboxypeptidase
MERHQTMTRGIGIAGMSGYDVDSNRVLRATEYFNRRGLQVTVAPAPTTPHMRFAGHDAERLAAFNSLLERDDLAIIMGQRGGYGMTRLIGGIDFDFVARRISATGVKLVGHSDWTVLTLALLAHTGATTHCGPMASYDFGADVVPFTEQHFWSVMDGAMELATWPVARPDSHATGILWGGNLSMVCSLLGTPHLPRIEGGILVIEDINEHPYRIERMLLQLLHSGILASQSAILVGDISGYRLAEFDNGYDLDEALARVGEECRTPMFRGLPFGHVPSKITFPVGAMADFSMQDGIARLTLAASLS